MYSNIPIKPGSIKYELESKRNNTVVQCTAILKNEVCRCQVYTNDEHSVWTISSWFTKEGFGGKGIGKNTLQKALGFLTVRYGIPDRIEYIWNGENEYVLSWMTEHFDAFCSCPVAIQKTQADDDWASHVYELDVDKVLAYFAIEKTAPEPEADLEMQRSE